MNERVGLGFDVHRLEEGRPCILGGVSIDHPAGPAGHSDGDAVLHAPHERAARLELYPVGVARKDPVDALLRLGDAYSVLGRYEDARLVYARVPAATPDRQGGDYALYQTAQAFGREGRGDDDGQMRQPFEVARVIDRLDRDPLQRVAPRLGRHPGENR